MMHFGSDAKYYTDPERLAADYLAKYFNDRKIEYPINPFQMLKDEGVLFFLQDYEKLEGVYIPSTSPDDIPMVGINANRPITRQRFSAAHELCHHFRDADKEISCPIGGKNAVEKFAEAFAAALLMPLDELKTQVDNRKDSESNVSFDKVLEIADFFGVSFEACLFRIAYVIHAIDGNTAPDDLRMRIRDYKPEKERKLHHMSYTKLYEGLIDCYQEQLAFRPTERARIIFQNEYIYNDSRMEGLEVTQEQSSEIVTDLRMKKQNSVYCNEKNEAYLSIAGQYDMYQEILSDHVIDSLNVYLTFKLNRLLFSYYPHPEFGGSTRQNNTLVLGAKFETVDYQEIPTELAKVDAEVRDYFCRRSSISMSEYVEHVVRTHHRITVIHPFPEGNGRTSRAFMNVQLVSAEIVPIYIKVEDKKEYIEALARADQYNDYNDLYEIVFKLIIRSHIELCKK